MNCRGNGKKAVRSVLLNQPSKHFSTFTSGINSLLCRLAFDCVVALVDGVREYGGNYGHEYWAGICARALRHVVESVLHTFHRRTCCARSAAFVVWFGNDLIFEPARRRVGAVNHYSMFFILRQHHGKRIVAVSQSCHDAAIEVSTERPRCTFPTGLTRHHCFDHAAGSSAIVLVGHEHRIGDDGSAQKTFLSRRSGAPSKSLTERVPSSILDGLASSNVRRCPNFSGKRMRQRNISVLRLGTHP